MTFNRLKANEQSYNYMDLMHRAYQSASTRNPGAHNRDFENLIEAEYGTSPVNYLPAFNVQFDKIQEYLFFAFDKFLNMPKLANKHAELLSQKLLLNKAESSESLIEIINNTMKLTQAVKNYS